MDIENIAVIVTSLAALGGAYIALRRAMKVDEPKGSSDIEHSNAETIVILSNQLQEAYKRNDELRKNVDSISCHIDYEAYMLRGIARLIAALATNELSVPWTPISFDDFVKRENSKRV